MPITQNRLLDLVAAADKILLAYTRVGNAIRQIKDDHPIMAELLVAIENPNLPIQTKKALVFNLRDHILSLVMMNNPYDAIEIIAHERGKLAARRKSNENHAEYMRRRRIANRSAQSDEREIVESFGEQPRGLAAPQTSAIPLRLEPITLPELREHLWSKFGTGIIYQSQVAEELAALGEPNLPEQIRIIKELLESNLAKPGEFAGELLLTQQI